MRLTASGADAGASSESFGRPRRPRPGAAFLSRLCRGTLHGLRSRMLVRPGGASSSPLPPPGSPGMRPVHRAMAFHEPVVSPRPPRAARSAATRVTGVEIVDGAPPEFPPCGGSRLKRKANDRQARALQNTRSRSACFEISSELGGWARGKTPRESVAFFLFVGAMADPIEGNGRVPGGRTGRSRPGAAVVPATNVHPRAPRIAVPGSVHDGCADRHLSRRHVPACRAHPRRVRHAAAPSHPGQAGAPGELRCQAADDPIPYAAFILTRCGAVPSVRPERCRHRGQRSCRHPFRPVRRLRRSGIGCRHGDDRVARRSSAPTIATQARCGSAVVASADLAEAGR